MINVLNPDSGEKTLPIKIEIKAPNGDLIDSSDKAGADVIEITLEPGTIENVILSNSNYKVGE